MSSILVTVATYLFLRYIWEPHLLPLLDGVLRYNQAFLKQDIVKLRDYLNKDWLSYRTLPNPRVYLRLQKRIIVHAEKYLNDTRIMDYFVAEFEMFYTMFGHVYKPKNVELVRAHNQIHDTMLPILDRILTQLE